MRHSLLLFFGLLTLTSIHLSSCKSQKVKKAREQALRDSLATAALMDSLQLYLGEDTTGDELPNVVPAHYNPSASRVNDILHTKLEISFNFGTSQLYGKATLDVKPYFYPVDSLILDAKAFDVEQVALVGTGGAFSDLKYTNTGEFLRIALDRTYKRNEPYRVFIRYTANPEKVKQGGSMAISDAKGLYFIDPKEEDPHKPTQIWTQGETESNSCWFPTVDKPNEKMTHELVITVPKKYTTLSNGIRSASKEHADGTRIDTWKMELPHAPYLVMMAIGEYAVVKDTWRKITVDYYVEKEFEPYARRIFGNTPEMLEFFSKRLGVDYPWPKYSQVIVRDYVSGAMENTSATIFGEFVQQTPQEMIDNDYEDVIAHELFHHWFGDLVTCESWANLPLNESFATYGEYLWNEYKYGRDKADYHLQLDVSSYFEEYFQKKVNLIRFDYVKREDMFDRHSYQKGGAVLHMLRKYVGDEAFFEALKLYLTENRFQPAEIHHLRLAVEKVTGEDLNWFFNQWFLDRSHPYIDATWSWNESSRTVEIDMKQIQNMESAHLFRVPLDIDIYENGKARRVRIVLDSIRQHFSLPAPLKPDFVNIDAERMLVGRMMPHLSIEDATYMLLHLPLYMDRYLAIDRLLEEVSEPGVSETLKMALRDKFWYIRLMALQGLEEIIAGSPAEYRSQLELMAAKDSKSQVRAEALTRLAAVFPGDAGVFGMLEAALNDSSAFVQSAAIKAMYDSDPEKTLQVIEKLETTAKGELLNSIAGIYAASATPGKLDFMKKAYDGISGPNEKYFFIQSMGRYVLSQDESTLRSSVGTFEDIARRAPAWWLRLAGIQVLSEIQTRYDSQVDELSAEIMAMKEKGTAVSAIREKEAQQALFKKQAVSLEETLKEIRKEEKDPTLSKLLNLMSGNE